MDTNCFHDYFVIFVSVFGIVFLLMTGVGGLNPLFSTVGLLALLAMGSIRTILHKKEIERLREKI